MRPNRAITTACLVLYSALTESVFFIVWLVALTSKGLQRGVLGRYWSTNSFLELEAYLAPFSSRYLFFCSSAGEYEQAKPIMSALQSESDTGIVVIFFSPSGPGFAKIRGEENFFHLAPPDSLFRWLKIFSIVKPKGTIVIRYELWPAFLLVAREFGPLWLVDAVRSPSVVSSSLHWFIRSRLMSVFDRVYAVDEEDRSYFQSLNIDDDRLYVVGDTKYDQVMEFRQRASLRKDEWLHRFDDWWGRCKLLIVGSGWHKDIELVLESYSKGKAAGHLYDWRVIIAPHDVSVGMIQWIEGRLKDKGLSYGRLSDNPQEILSETKDAILIVDEIGLLTELYGTADAAFVGGALHHRVHNVLEPASYGLAIAFGPKHTTSKEACLLVANGLARVVKDECELSSWWREAAVGISQREKTLAWMQSLCGASQQISQNIRSEIREQNS